ncbi:hypothetical protein BVRB_5g099010 [Beta vulgaris subsp. vulgaris]|uniref:uncharacterized protein LOC104892169 n=1 Tax=Beta vulgaris subsp. vulgaris TaxID=3555 RepID=UPI00053FCBCA|nr:uncharacterized protein LOC104892169 [Beta vulgaris subsp. vulgaris]KMT11937.1 hypothetical protein BVRB_5g099010 [Beta vulgaris subsp. vulgaris]
MASTKLQKPTNEEHKFSQKISEVTAWGNRVFGQKQQEHQAVAKHCTTCHCPASKDTKPACNDLQKKENANTISVKDMKSDAHAVTKKKEHASTIHKDAKHTTCAELKKEEKQHTANFQSKDSKKPAGAEIKKEKKEHHAKSNTTTACNTLVKKEHKDEPTNNHCFSSMADHWKEKIMMMKKAKDGKCKDNSSSSGSDSEDDASVIKKKDKRHS